MFETTRVIKGTSKLQLGLRYQNEWTMKYDLTCDCYAEKYPVIERAVGGMPSYDNNIFKALLFEGCIKEHGEVVKAEEGC